MVLHILGVILKIIGIILLCILLLLLFVLLVLLFVPLRYRAQFFREGKNIAAHAQISYLFRLIYLPVDFKDGKLKLSLKIFGFTFFSNEEGAERKKKKAAKKEEKKEASEKEKRGEEEKGEMPETREDLPEEPKDYDNVKITSSFTQPICAASVNISGLAAPESGRGILAKIARKLRILYKKFVVIYQKIRRSIKNILEKISFGRKKIADLREKAQLIFTFLRNEENKNGIKYAGKSILQLLKHVLPYKIEGDLVFATGNAYSMGKALSILGMFYPLYGKRLTLTADFEADAFRLEGRMQLAGRIRFGTILWIAFKLWRKGRILALVSSAKELKHKLTTSAL